MNNQEFLSVEPEGKQIDTAVDAAASESDMLELKIAEILGQSSVDFIEKTVSEHLGDGYESNDLGLVEKINLILILASKKKIVVSSGLLRAVKSVTTILPNGQIDIEYLIHLKGEKRKHLFQVISSLILLLGLSFGVGNELVGRIQNTENRNKVELSASAVDDENAKALESRTKFERQFSSDLETVVAEMGWQDFLGEYTKENNESVWSSEEVFQLLRTQEPRYWGYYIIAYPNTFVEAVDTSQVSQVEFMSSCGDVRFFSYLQTQMGGDVTWLDLWSADELFETLRMTNPNWGKIVANNQVLFVGVLDREDLTPLVHMLAPTANSADMHYFLRDYENDWDQTWSRRELLDAMKADGSVSWGFYVKRYMHLFASDITEEELSEVIEDISFSSSGLYPSTNDLAFFSDYYKLQLYEVVDPAAFVRLIETHFSKEIAAQILANYPELNQLEQSNIERLFETEAINYVLDNYAQWESVYPIVDIMTFLRDSDQKYHYALIVPHPELFQEISFTDDEVVLLAFRNNFMETTGEKKKFFHNYQGQFGWENQIPVERMLKLGRSKPGDGMYTAALYFPEIFLPHFTDEDMYQLVLSNSIDLEEVDVLHSTNPIWKPFTTVERRHTMLELAKNDTEQDWEELVASRFYFFEDILTFDEAKDILSKYHSSTIRNSPLWQNNVTPEWEYSFFKESNEDIFIHLIANDPVYFSEQLTEGDKLLVLKNKPEVILDNYLFWQKFFSPEFILDYFYSGQSAENYGYFVLRNKHIFGHVFYNSGYDLKNSIMHGGLDTLFDTNYDTDQYYYEEWSEFVSIEELFYILEGFEDGRVKILTRPNLFFEFVEFSDLNQFVQTEHCISALLGSYDDWQELWSFADIYEAVKATDPSYSAFELFSSDYAEDFIKLTSHDDLQFLIRSYPDDLSYIFGSNLEILLKKWTAEEILTALKQEHPDTWGAFVTDGIVHFDALLSQSDLESLIAHGANPAGLMETGLWEVDEVFDVYKNNFPEKWGEIILTNSEIFMEEVIRRDVSLQQLLEFTDITIAYEYTYYWRDVWSEIEIEDALHAVYGDALPVYDEAAG